jgi:hypothetical protein
MVTVKSPNLIRAQSATSNAQGRYSIQNLPPGRYTLTTEAAGGFDRFEQRDVEVNLSKTATVLIELQPASVAAHITINASGALVDTTGNTSGTNVSTDQFSNFTTQRTVQSLYTIAPGVTRSGLRDASGRERDPSVAGSSGPENAYILDGVNTADPVFGGSGANRPSSSQVGIKPGPGALSMVFQPAVFSTPSPRVVADTRTYSLISQLGMVVVNSLHGFAGRLEIDAGSTSADRSGKTSFYSSARSIRSGAKTFCLLRPSLTGQQQDHDAILCRQANLPDHKHILTFSTFADFTTVDGFV